MRSNASAPVRAGRRAVRNAEGLDDEDTGFDLGEAMRAIHVELDALDAEAAVLTRTSKVRFEKVVGRAPAGTGARRGVAPTLV